MKTLFTIIGVLVVAVLVIFFVSSRSADAPTEMATSSDAESSEELSGLEDGEYVVSSSDSTVEWQTEKPLVSGYADTGFIPIVDGAVTVEGGAITAAEITLNVADITATETPNTRFGVDRLTTHIRSDDFLEVETYPTATFSITNVTETEAGYGVTGDLTIKGVTNAITFPATAGMVDDEFVFDGATTIDRSLWNIRYGSDTFFDDLGDSVISDEVEISFHIVGQRQN
ncbi:MAG: YceI family protein [Candidatus Paceibacterota bacterium]